MRTGAAWSPFPEVAGTPCRAPLPLPAPPRPPAGRLPHLGGSRGGSGGLRGEGWRGAGAGTHRCGGTGPPASPPRHPRGRRSPAPRCAVSVCPAVCPAGRPPRPPLARALAQAALRELAALPGRRHHGNGAAGAAAAAGAAPGGDGAGRGGVTHTGADTHTGVPGAARSLWAAAGGGVFLTPSLNLPWLA